MIEHPTKLWFEIMLCLYKNGGLTPKELRDKITLLFGNCKNPYQAIPKEMLRLMKDGLAYATLTPDKKFHLTDEGKAMVVSSLKKIRSAYET